MKNAIKAVGAFFGSTAGKVSGAIAGAAVVLAAPSLAGADAVTSGFTSTGTTLTGYLGDAVVLVLAVLGLGLGIRMLIKWARRAVAAT
jgi:hypothetical protein